MHNRCAGSCSFIVSVTTDGAGMIEPGVAGARVTGSRLGSKAGGIVYMPQAMGVADFWEVCCTLADAC